MDKELKKTGKIFRILTNEGNIIEREEYRRKFIVDSFFEIDGSFFIFPRSRILEDVTEKRKK